MMPGILHFVVIASFFCCTSARPYQFTTQDLSLKAINDLLANWYDAHNSSPCMNGTYKVEVNDTLKLRSFRYAAPKKEVQSKLIRYGIDWSANKLATDLVNESKEIRFIHDRVKFFTVSEKEPICSQYYFSTLYRTHIDPVTPGAQHPQYIIQYIMNSYELVEEGLLLLNWDGNKFRISDHLIFTPVWN